MTRYLTSEEAADRLRMTVPTIGRSCAAGIIPATKFGNKWRIAEDVIDSMLAPTNQGPGVRSTASRRRSA